MRLKHKLLSRGVVTVATTVGASLVTSSAQGASIGDIGISGASTMSESGSTTTISFQTIDQVDPADTAGAFAQYDNTTPTFTGPITLSRISGNTYSYNAVNDLYTLDDGSGKITTFDLAAGQATRFASGNDATYQFLAFDGDYDGFIDAPGTGILDVSTTDLSGGGVGEFSLTQEAVPEPMTILGSGLALGFGAFFRKKKAKQ